MKHARTAKERAGRVSFPAYKGDLPDMTPEQWEEWDAAFGPEPNMPEECAYPPDPEQGH